LAESEANAAGWYHRSQFIRIPKVGLMPK